MMLLLTVYICLCIRAQFYERNDTKDRYQWISIRISRNIILKGWRLTCNQVQTRVAVPISDAFASEAFKGVQ